MRVEFIRVLLLAGMCNYKLFIENIGISFMVGLLVIVFLLFFIYGLIFIALLYRHRYNILGIEYKRSSQTNTQLH